MRIARRMLSPTLLPALLLAVAACGPAGHAPAGSRPAIGDLATKAGCAVIVDTPSANAAEEGSCDGLTITTFDTAAKRDAWLKAGEGAGPFLVGDLFVISGGDQQTLGKLSGKVGGAVRG
jgi:hypothetical protein